MVLLKDMFEEAKKKYPPHNKTKAYKRTNKNGETGFYNVRRMECKGCKQGIIYTYITLRDDGKRKHISSVDFLRLKEKIVKEKLPWGVNNRSKAIKTAKEVGYSLNELE